MTDWTWGRDWNHEYDPDKNVEHRKGKEYWAFYLLKEMSEKC